MHQSSASSSSGKRSGLMMKRSRKLQLMCFKCLASLVLLHRSSSRMRPASDVCKAGLPGCQRDGWFSHRRCQYDTLLWWLVLQQ